MPQMSEIPFCSTILTNSISTLRIFLAPIWTTTQYILICEYLMTQLLCVNMAINQIMF